MNDLINSIIYWRIRKCILTIITVFVTLLLLNGCRSDNQTADEKPNKKTIVILFDSTSIETFSRQYASIKYLDDNLIPRTRNYALSLSSDTKVTIQTRRDYLDIAYKDKSRVTKRFLIKNGDSLLLSLKQKKPVFTLLNHRTLPAYDVNYHRLKNDSLYSGKLPGIEDYYYLHREINSPYSLIAHDEEMMEELEKLKKKAYANLKQENVFIDSLMVKGLISKAQGDYFQLENSFNLEVLHLYQNDGISFSDSIATGKLLSHKTYQAGDGEINLLNCTFYHDLLDLYYRDFLMLKVGERPNLALYDTIKAIDYLEEDIKRSLLLKYSDNLLTTLPVDDKENYLNFFSKDLDNQAWTDYLVIKHKAVDIFSGELKLTDKNNNSFTAELLLFDNKGKLLYIDIWAAWCLPCIKEIPNSIALSDEYQYKDVTFAYLSLDQNIGHWTSAEEKYLNKDRQQSYFVDSLNVALINREFGIKSIPRYLLYNKQGELIHDNAPRPGSTEIRKLLDLYLEEKQ